MPVATPEPILPVYENDAGHFAHVLEYLFVPAIKLAEFKAIRPIAQGADVIQAEIIKNLETAELVLCDISTLNPNVFFELGCRTALNKPVCYVKDDLTARIPFDTGIINHHTYNHSLAHWTLEREIEKLAAHIGTCAKRSASGNMLWHYFGLRSTAHAAPTDSPEADRLEYLVMQVEALRKSVAEQQTFQPLNFGYGTMPYPPYGDPNQANLQPVFSFIPRDWDQVLSAADRDLEGILKVRKNPQIRASLAEVRSVIDGHIKDLQDLLKESPNGVDMNKAQHLLDKFKMLRSGKTPE